MWIRLITTLAAMALDLEIKKLRSFKKILELVANTAKYRVFFTKTKFY